MRNHRLIMLTVCAGVFALVVGCNKKEPIQTYKAPKDPPAVVASAQGGDDEHSSEPHIHWTVPEGWRPLPAGAMSYAVFSVSQDPPMSVTVTSAMGSVLANVNRWQGQLGLQPSSSEAELGKVVSPMKIAEVDAAMVDLLGPSPAPDGGAQKRMLAAIVPGNGRVWFFKLMGPVEKVNEVGAAFETFVKSVRFDGGGDEKNPAAVANANSGTSASAAGAKIEGIASYSLPEAWKVDSTPRPMRVGTIVVPSGNEQAEMAVSKFNASSYADKTMNINRWRGQVKLPPVDGNTAQRTVAVETASGPAEMFDFAGPESEGPGRKRLLVAVLPSRGGEIWFFRFLGPHDLVEKSKPAFEAFVRSLKLEQ